VTISHSDAPEEALKMKESVLSLVETDRVYESQIGSVIGTHVGPGCICVQVFPE
jgi:fatty acid-binding protein DegV